jgi:hypothetical protein
LSSNLREPNDEEYLNGWLDLRNVSHDYLINKREALYHALMDPPKYRIIGDPRHFKNTKRNGTVSRSEHLEV